jgi:anti-sigma regulatory factor (Ser/Thr protein kinase)
MACEPLLSELSLVDGPEAASAHCDLPCTPAAVPLARRFVQGILRDLPSGVVHDVSLLTSELVTNVVIHARTDVHIGVSHDARTVLVCVQDGSEEPPGQCSDISPEAMAAIGRGMAIIAATADDFGWRRVPGKPGKLIWFSVGIPVRPTVVPLAREEPAVTT